MSKISVRSLYKIFGRRPKEVLEQVRAGAGKDEVLAKTGHTVGLDDISLVAEAGETFVVMGLSGSGKSTLVRCLNRLVEPTSGQILIDGVDIVRLSAREMQELRRGKIAMVFQHFALLPHRDVLDNVAYGLKLQGLGRSERYERAAHWIEVVGLKGYEAARPVALSGGMQQRVGLARALATDPEILLMDEPFSALDPLIRREMQDELVRLQQELNKTIVFITHDLDEALRLGDRVAILKAGRVVQVGTPGEILATPADEYVRSFVRDVDRGRVLTVGDVSEPGLQTTPEVSPTALLPLLSDDPWRTAYVKRTDGRYLGVVTLADVRAAIRRGDSTLRDIITESAPTVAQSSALADVYSVAAASPVPIAVLGEDERLTGVLTHRALISALARHEDEVALETGDLAREAADTKRATDS